jgi:hypothetical protein
VDRRNHLVREASKIVFQGKIEPGGDENTRPNRPRNVPANEWETTAGNKTNDRAAMAHEARAKAALAGSEPGTCGIGHGEKAGFRL